jgi:Tfp pilus assembly protein PilF
MKAKIWITTYIVSAIVIQSAPCTTTKASRHKFAVGGRMPEFSATTFENRKFTYKYKQDKALMVVFLSHGNKRSARAANDIKEIIQQLRTNIDHLEIVIVVDDTKAFDFSSMQKGPVQNIHVVLDSEYKLWGTFGIIATPTVVISDTHDKVLGIKAGHGYDFVPVIRTYLNQALGLAQQKSPQEASHIETVANDTIAARVKRHLQMAKILEQKNHHESAISEIKKARQLDPNSAEVALELGELLCRAGLSKAALEITQSLKVTKRIDKARLLLVSGWAKRQIDSLDEAEKLLLESTALDPKSPRAFFELGKVYQSQQQTDKAMKAYHKALAIIFGEAGSLTISH